MVCYPEEPTTGCDIPDCNVCSATVGVCDECAPGHSWNWDYSYC
jgi:hypothetical protein